MTPSDAERQFLDAFSRALRDAGPETNRSGWYAKMAEETGLGEEAIKKWVYGQNAPNFHSFLVLLDYLGMDFGNKILALIGYKLVPSDSDEAKHSADNTRLRGLLTETLDVLDSANAHMQIVAKEIKKQKPPSGQVPLVHKKPKAAA